MAADGLITVPSRYGAKETADPLAAGVEARGMTLNPAVDSRRGGNLRPDLQP